MNNNNNIKNNNNINNNNNYNNNTVVNKNIYIENHNKMNDKDYSIFHSNNSLSESTNSNESSPDVFDKTLITTKKILSFPNNNKTKKDTIPKRTVTQRPVSSRIKSASSLKTKSNKSQSKKKASSGSNNKNNTNDSYGDIEIKKLRNDITEIQEIMTKSSQRK